MELFIKTKRLHEDDKKLINENCINQNNLRELQEMDIPENIKNLTPNQFWLLEHQITAFWHAFGFSNSKGLIIPKEMVEDFKYPKEKGEYVVISKEFLNQKLADYIKWLTDYKESWNEKKEYDCYPKDLQEFLKSESIHESRKPIFEMICLLQNNNGGKQIE